MMFAVKLGQCEHQPLTQLLTDGNRVEVTYFNQRNQPFKNNASQDSNRQ